MTTTGYGDMVPRTLAGKLIGCGAMLCGLILLALPITIFSSNFAHQYQLNAKRQKEAREKAKKAKKRRPRLSIYGMKRTKKGSSITASSSAWRFTLAQVGWVMCASVCECLLSCGDVAIFIIMLFIVIIIIIIERTLSKCV
jgi:hypothetical protein